MKIALIGYGKMGKEIERIALERGHSVVARIDFNTEDTFDSPNFKSADVVIEFTVPHAAYQNYLQCFKHNLPVVSGTTGWLDQIGEIKKACSEGGQTFFYASNFSLGVNIFFALNKQLAKLMERTEGYKASMVEVHHTQKLDAPSGTAITLAEGIIENNSNVKSWVLGDATDDTQIPIEALREGVVPGIHTIKYESSVDEIIIHHSAKSREGFALGAVVAAEFTQKNKGFLGMDNLLNL